MKKYQRGWSSERASKRRKRLKKRKNIILFCLILLFLAISTFLPSETADSGQRGKVARSSQKKATTSQPEALKLKSAGIFTVYAYNSVPSQTDSSPCISADGKDICLRFSQGLKMVATNDFPLGTELFIKGFGRFIVVDRMNSRYSGTIDIFMGYDIEKARDFGKKRLEIMVVDD